MKEKILAELKTKFIGVPEAILDRIATQRAKTVTTEEAVNSLIEGITLQHIFESYGDSRATEASITAVSNYEKKHNIKDGKPNLVSPMEGIQPNDELKSSSMEDVKAVISEMIKPLADTVSKQEQQIKMEKRNAEIIVKAKEYGIPEDFITDLKIAEDADLDVSMKSFQQKFANIGFKGAQTPELGDTNHDDSNDIANLINKGTKEIVEQPKTN